MQPVNRSAQYRISSARSPKVRRKARFLEPIYWAKFPSKKISPLTSQTETAAANNDKSNEPSEAEGDLNEIITFEHVNIESDAACTRTGLERKFARKNVFQRLCVN